MDIGVPQGAVLSPLLYATYIDGLHDCLRAAGCGIFVFGRLVPLLLFADDIVLLTDSPDQLEKALQCVSEYANRWRFTFNNKKSNIVVLGSDDAKSIARNMTWILAGKEPDEAKLQLMQFFREFST